jgi:hypothetical protein
MGLINLCMHSFVLALDLGGHLPWFWLLHFVIVYNHPHFGIAVLISSVSTASFKITVCASEILFLYHPYESDKKHYCWLENPLYGLIIPEDYWIQYRLAHTEIKLTSLFQSLWYDVFTSCWFSFVVGRWTVTFLLWSSVEQLTGRVPIYHHQWLAAVEHRDPTVQHKGKYVSSN